MNTKIGRFFTFIMKEKTQKFFAFAFYISFIVIVIDLPLALDFILLMFISLLYCTSCISERLNKRYKRSNLQLRKSIIQKIRKIVKEILKFIPILLISNCIISFICVGQPANQTSIEKSFYEAPISNSIVIIITGPIIEEFVFRFLPYNFIKNKILYIIVSTVVFAAMHVLNDPNPFYYIWFYIIGSFYYAYSYHKTNDILVTVSMHSLNNLVETLLFVFS